MGYAVILADKFTIQVVERNNSGRPKGLYMESAKGVQQQMPGRRDADSVH
jgi:hypothetical protein